MRVLHGNSFTSCQRELHSHTANKNPANAGARVGLAEAESDVRVQHIKGTAQRGNVALHSMAGDIS